MRGEVLQGISDNFFSKCSRGQGASLDKVAQQFAPAVDVEVPVQRGHVAVDGGGRAVHAVGDLLFAETLQQAFERFAQPKRQAVLAALVGGGESAADQRSSPLTPHPPSPRPRPAWNQISYQSRQLELPDQLLQCVKFVCGLDGTPTMAHPIIGYSFPICSPHRRVRFRAIRVNNGRRLFCVRSNHRRGRGGTKAQRECLIERMVIDWNRWTNITETRYVRFSHLCRR